MTLMWTTSVGAVMGVMQDETASVLVPKFEVAHTTYGAACNPKLQIGFAETSERLRRRHRRRALSDPGSKNIDPSRSNE